MYRQHPDRNPAPTINEAVTQKMLDSYESMVTNATNQRSALLNKLLDPRRNLNKECGYPETGEITAEMYKNLYFRESIATRVVQVEAKETWQLTPSVYEDEDLETDTEFEKAWDSLSQHLRGGESWFKDEESSPIWEHLRRVDILSGIGSFGVLLLGLDDGQQLQFPVAGTPADGFVKDVTGQDADTKGDRDEANPPTTAYGSPVAGQSYAAGSLGASLGTDAQYFNSYNPGQSPERKDGEPLHLIFLRAFDESLVQIVQYEASITNPRFGQPVMYLVTLNDPLEQHSGVGLPLATVRVHWSRIIHVADNLGSSEIFGVPRMRPVFNRLLDVAKLYGGCAEMYWRGAFPGLSIESHPQLGGDVIVDETAMRDMMDNYFNKVDRAIALKGFTAKSLAPQVVDPTPQINAELNAICIQLAIPLRIFMGSEQGKLAADQDSTTWNTKRVPERRKGYVTQRIIIPFVDRLIMIGVLPKPNAKGKKTPTGNTLCYGQLVEIRGSGKRALLVNWAGFNEESLESHYMVRGADSEIIVNASELTTIKPQQEKISTAGQSDEILMEDEDSNSTISQEESQEEGVGYHVKWPDPVDMSATEKATVFLTRMQAMSAYQQGGVESILDPTNMLTKEAGYTDEETEQILEDTVSHLDDSYGEQSDEDVTTPGHIPEKSLPEPEPGSPIKMGQGETLFDPNQGKVMHATKPVPKTPVKNANHNWPVTTFTEKVITATRVPGEPIDTGVENSRGWDEEDFLNEFDIGGESDPTLEEQAEIIAEEEFDL